MELIVENLTKTYSNKVKALDNVNLRIGVGMFGLLGPNGAGKSTLMRTIATIQSPDEGKIHFNEIDVSRKLSNNNKCLIPKTPNIGKTSIKYHINKYINI